MGKMSEWIDINERMPEKDMDTVMVSCKGGNVTFSFFIKNRDYAKSHFNSPSRGSSYSRKYQGKNSCHFEISHEFGYEILAWKEMPTPYPEK